MAEKVPIPLLLKHEVSTRMYISLFKGFLYAIREKYGATAALELYSRVCTMDDRIRNLTNSLLDIFKLEGNDAETIGKWIIIYFKLAGFEHIPLELSNTKSRIKVTKCPFKTDPKDISDWALIFFNIAAKTINPKAICERPMGMCAGDPYCEYVWKLEE